MLGKDMQICQGRSTPLKGVAPLTLAIDLKPHSNWQSFMAGFPLHCIQFEGLGPGRVHLFKFESQQSNSLLRKDLP